VGGGGKVSHKIGEGLNGHCCKLRTLRTKPFWVGGAGGLHDEGPELADAGGEKDKKQVSEGGGLT